VLALTLPAEGRIVYTHAHEYIEPGAMIPLDVSHDEYPNFYFKDVRYHGSTYSSACVLRIDAAHHVNEIVGPPHRGTFGNASALVYGEEVGPSDRFYSYNRRLAGEYANQGKFCFGQWCVTGSRFLGLKFINIKGETHYGWARLEVYHRLEPVTKVWAVLTGYAYETIPNKPIKAGQTHSGNETAPGTGTLGALARGAK